VIYFTPKNVRSILDQLDFGEDLFRCTGLRNSNLHNSAAPIQFKFFIVSFWLQYWVIVLSYCSV